MADGMTPTEDVDEAGVDRAQHLRDPGERRQPALRQPRAPEAAEGPQPRLRIVVAGCLAQKDQGLIQRRRRGSTWWSARTPCPQLLDLLQRVGDRGPADGRPRVHGDRSRAPCPAARQVAFHAWVSIAAGCDNACTFCIVPLVRGPQRSRRSATSWPRSRGSPRPGVVEVTLLGQNVNTYGRDVTVPGSSRAPLFADLLREVNEVDGIRRIRFTSPHPHDFTPDVIDAMAESREGVRAHPLPAAVGLGPRAEGDAALVPAGALPRVARRGSARRSPASRCRPTSSSGFPGETEEDFAETLEVVEQARFDSAFMFQYSPRPGHAGGLDVDEPGPEGGRAGAVRPARRAPGAHRARAEPARRSGRTVEVLVEGGGKKGGSTQARTRTNRIVHLPERARARARSSHARVVAAAPHHLVGERRAGARRRPGLSDGAWPLLLALVGPTASRQDRGGDRAGAQASAPRS